MLLPGLRPRRRAPVARPALAGRTRKVALEAAPSSQGILIRLPAAIVGGGTINLPFETSPGMVSPGAGTVAPGRRCG